MRWNRSINKLPLTYRICLLKARKNWALIPTFNVIEVISHFLKWWANDTLLKSKLKSKRNKVNWNRKYRYNPSLPMNLFPRPIDTSRISKTLNTTLQLRRRYRTYQVMIYLSKRVWNWSSGQTNFKLILMAISYRTLKEPEMRSPVKFKPSRKSEMSLRNTLQRRE